jgi:DNA-directed RNA polymerase specialized sigma24 family protein
MTTNERESCVLSHLECVTPMLHSYAATAKLDFEDLRQDATLVILHVLERADSIRDLKPYIKASVRNACINKIHYTNQRRMISLDEPLFDETDGATLADMLPSPYVVEPLTLLLTQERLLELRSQFTMQPMNFQHARVVREWHDTALASSTL